MKIRINRNNQYFERAFEIVADDESRIFGAVNADNEEFANRIPGPDMKTEVGCHSCGAMNLMQWDVSDFLFRLPKRRKT